MYSSRDRRPDVFYDEESSNEADEEVHEELLGFEPQDNERAESSESEDEPREVGRRRSIIKGKNNFRCSLNTPETRGRRQLRVYLQSANAEAKNIATPFDTWTLLFTQEMLEMIVQETNEEIGRRLEANVDNVLHFVKTLL